MQSDTRERGFERESGEGAFKVIAAEINKTKSPEQSMSKAAFGAVSIIVCEEAVCFFEICLFTLEFAIFVPPKYVMIGISYSQN